MYIRCLNTLDPTALPQMKLPWQISHFNSWELCSVRASQEMHFTKQWALLHYLWLAALPLSLGFCFGIERDTIPYIGASEKPRINAVKLVTNWFWFLAYRINHHHRLRTVRKTDTSQLLFSRKALGPFFTEIIYILGITCCIKQVLSINFW